jgi:uncharacterized membrane protein
MPLSTGFFLVLAIVGLLVVGLLVFDALSHVYQRIGIAVGWMALILVAALLGSLINIPVATLWSVGHEISAQVTVFGVTYRVPLVVRTGRPTIAVNVGAIVPRLSRST